MRACPRTCMSMHATRACAPCAQPGWQEVSSTGGGYVVKPNVTYMELPDGFSQLERILLTANANVERIIGSYYNMPTVVHVMQNYRREPCVYDRRTAMLLNGDEFMCAAHSQRLLRHSQLSFIALIHWCQGTRRVPST